MAKFFKELFKCTLFGTAIYLLVKYFQKKPMTMDYEPPSPPPPPEPEEKNKEE